MFPQWENQMLKNGQLCRLHLTSNSHPFRDLADKLFISGCKSSQAESRVSDAAVTRQMITLISHADKLLL